jgi:MFS family permease
MLSTYGLQVLAPDHVRGRIFGFDYMLVTLSLSISAVIASALADAIGVQHAISILGGVALLWAIVWLFLIRGVRRMGLEGAAEAEPCAEREQLPAIS